MSPPPAAAAGGPLSSGLQTLLKKRSLSAREASQAMMEIVSGNAPSAQIAAFLTALRLKGETPEDIAGCASALRQTLIPVKTRARIIVDTCGTGGDGKKSFNISTAAAFVAAGAGLTVAKHGNRSVSSRCGSADVLEALGVDLEMEPLRAQKALDEIGIAFLFAPRYQPVLRHAMPVRRELGFRTIFNILGPLTNPAGANAQLIGVPEARLTQDMALAMIRLGEKRGMVIHTEGWDEITLTGPTTVVRIRGGSTVSLALTPRDFGLEPVTPHDLQGGDARKNASLILKILEGRPLPQRRVVVANAAAAIWNAGGRSGHEIPLKEAVKIAQEAIDSGAALHKLQKLSRFNPSARPHKDRAPR